MNQIVAQPTMKDLAAMPLDQAIQANTQQFANALPAHIPVERFKRVMMTAISSNPDLASADRRSLFNSGVKAAQDGLLPDGREGALVIYNTKVKVDGQEQWVKMVQWMPMIAGIRKKIRNSGEISDLYAEVVFEKDVFEYELGLDRSMTHKPAFRMALKDRGPIIGAYSVAKLKDGSTSFDVMSADEIWDVWRKSSKQKDKAGNPTGMWKDHVAEAFKKTVVRRHSKQLPMSTDLDDLIRRDDDLYDMKGASDGVVKNAPPPRPQPSDFVVPAATQEVITEDGEIIEDEQQAQPAAPSPDPAGEASPVASTVSNDGPGDAPAPVDPSTDEIWNDGYLSHGEGKSLHGYAPDLTEAERVKWKDGWNAADMERKARVKS